MKFEAPKVYDCAKLEGPKFGYVFFLLLLLIRNKKVVDGSGVFLNAVFSREEMMTWRVLTNKNERLMWRDIKRCVTWW